jgi:hypothetical protein
MKEIEIECPCGEYIYNITHDNKEKTAKPSYCAFCGVEIEEDDNYIKGDDAMGIVSDEDD